MMVSKSISSSLSQFILTSISFILIFMVDKMDAQGTWSEKIYFDATGRKGAVGFSINGKGYLGTGSNSTGLKKDFWQYNPDDEIWTQKADISGEERQYAVGFAIGNYGYIGTGDGLDYLKDFRQYNPVLNQWTNKSKLPGDKRAYATGFTIGSKGYIGSGFGPGGRKDYYEYDPTTDTWSQIADLPGAARSGAAGFSISGKGYVAFGNKSSSGETNELWEYDPSTGQWTQKSSCPGLPRHLAVAFVINEKAYVGTGLGDIEALNDFWQYNPATDGWVEVDSLPAVARYQSVAFAIESKGYVGTGSIGAGIYFDDFYEFTPECAAPTNQVTTNISTQSAKLKWNGGSNATKYKVQYKADSLGESWFSKTISASKSGITLNNLTPGTAYKWKVRSICGDEKSDYSSTVFFTTSLKLSNEVDNEIPFVVYPNPFTSDAIVSFSLEEDVLTKIEIFDLSGRKTLFLSEVLEAGEHEVILTREKIGEGIFLAKIITGNESFVIKIVVQ